MYDLRFVVVDDAVFMRTLLKKMIEEVEATRCWRRFQWI